MILHHKGLPRAVATRAGCHPRSERDHSFGDGVDVRETAEGVLKPAATGTATAHNVAMIQNAPAPNWLYNGPDAKVSTVEAAPTATVP